MFLPADFDQRNFPETGIRFEEIEAILDRITARRRLVFLDTCHAGESYVGPATDVSQALPSGVRQVRAFRELNPLAVAQPARRPENSIALLLPELFADLRRDSGAFVIAAAGAAEYALESDELRNGVFTSAILEALRGEAGGAKGSIRISELHRYVNERVLQLTNGNQRPMTRRENLEDDFPLI